MLQEFVDEGFKKIKDSAKKPSELEKVRGVFTDYLEFRVGGFELIGKTYSILRDSYTGSDIDKIEKNLSKFALRLCNIGEETGLRYDNNKLIAPQELALFQSGSGAEGISPTNTPYKPFAFEKLQKVDIEQLRLQRDKIRTYTAWAFYYGLGDDTVTITLEPIDDNGNTIRDPQPLDKQSHPIAIYTKSPNFPFRRD